MFCKLGDWNVSSNTALLENITTRKVSDLVRGNNMVDLNKHKTKADANRKQHFIRCDLETPIDVLYQRYQDVLQKYPADYYENKLLWDQFLKTKAAHERFSEKVEEEQEIMIGLSEE